MRIKFIIKLMDITLKKKRKRTTYKEASSRIQF